MRYELAAGMLIAMPAFADVPPISEIVDDRALVIVEVEDFSELADAADGAGLKELIENAQVQRFLEAVFSEDEVDDDTGFNALLETLDVDREDLSWPEGSVGFSLSLPESVEDYLQSEDFAEDIVEYRMAFTVDLGEGSELVKDAIETLVDIGLDKGFIEIQEDEKVGDARVLTLRSIVRTVSDQAFEEYYAEYEKRSNAAETDEDYEALWEWMENSSPETPFDDLEGMDLTLFNLFYMSSEFSYTWMDDTLVLTNHGESMLDMLDAIDGGLDNAASDSSFFADALDGLADDAQVRAAVDLGAFFAMSIASAQSMTDEFDPMAGMAEIGFDLLGMRDMSAMGVALSVDTPQVAEMRVRLVADEKVGWMRLLDLDAAAIDVPSFVPAEASGLAILRADFTQIVEIVEEVAAEMPGEQGEMLRAQVQQGLFIAKPIFDSLGSEVIIWNEQVSQEELEQTPLAGTVIALPLNDAAPLRNVLAGFGPMAGLTPREFLGAQVYESEMMPFSFGLGNNWLVVGTADSVEDTLRQTSEPRAGGLAASEEFRQAVDALGDARGVALTYQNADLYFEKLYEAAELFDSQQAEWWGEEWAEYRPAWLDLLPDIETITSHIGHTAGTIRATDDGFEMHVVMTKPE